MMAAVREKSALLALLVVEPSLHQRYSQVTFFRCANLKCRDMRIQKSQSSCVVSESSKNPVFSIHSRSCNTHRMGTKLFTRISSGSKSLENGTSRLTVAKPHFRLRIAR